MGAGAEGLAAAGATPLGTLGTADRMTPRQAAPTAASTNGYRLLTLATRPPVAADQLHLLEHVASGGVQQHGLGGAGWQLELGVERVEGEPVAMGGARWGTGSVPARSAKVVDPLGRRHRLGEPGLAG